jgi:cytochrome c oxidase cbb3-type subunit 3
MGAPDLADQIWLYAPDKKTIMEGLWNGRGGVMPAWGGKLDDVTIKALAVYVHTLGGGE